MGSSDRDYNQGSGSDGDYLGNPAAILNLSVPFLSLAGVRIRLHFWLLLSFAFCLASLFRGVPPLLVGMVIGFVLIALICHEIGHRIFAHWVDGRHDEFMLWPAGGMIFPEVPPGALPLFVANVGGIAANTILAAASLVMAYYLGQNFTIPFDPLIALGAGTNVILFLGRSHDMLGVVLAVFGLCNWLIVMVNLLPYFWFDGGNLLQSILWPFLGSFGAINVTCIVGMILAVPMFFIQLSNNNFLSLVLWTLLFSSAYSRRRQLQTEGTAELDESIAWSAQSPVKSRVRPKRKWMQPDFAKKAAAQAARESREQAELDAILAKVSATGLLSLTRAEKKALEKATQRQRENQG